MKKAPPTSKYGPPIDLRELEEEVLLEGREWMRKRMEQKLREKTAAFSPDKLPDAQEHPTPETDS